MKDAMNGIAVRTAIILPIYTYVERVVWIALIVILFLVCVCVVYSLSYITELKYLAAASGAACWNSARTL